MTKISFLTAPFLTALLAAACAMAAPLAHAADAVDLLKSFVHDVKTGRAAFTQTVISPDGAKRKSSSGTFEFARPNRFRFAYTQPFEQLIVADGQQVWLFDADLNQVTVRKLSQALAATPAALLAGSALDNDFVLSNLPVRDGLLWVQAVPKLKDSGFESVRVGFRGTQLAAIEIADSFGQRSLLQFTQVQANPLLAPNTFQYTPAIGIDVIRQ